LMMGLMRKEETEGILVRGKTIPVMFFVLFLSVGWFVMGLNMYPVQSDIQEMQTAINLAKDLNVRLYNDWGDGWTFVWLGYDTNYKITSPNPDWNTLARPFVAYSKEKIVGCEYIAKKTQKC